MPEYTDVPTINTLHGESERTQAALDMLNAGGTMASFTVAPPPVLPGEPTSMMMTTTVIQVTEPLSPEFMTQLNLWLVNRQSLIIAELAKYDVNPPPPPPTTPPVVTVAPVCAQDGNNLTCTTGTWDGMPTSYNYQWKNGSGAAVGGNFNSYPIAFADVGVSFTCTVTATNIVGSTAAAPSNSVVVVAPP